MTNSAMFGYIRECLSAAEARVEQIKRRGASMGGPRVAPWSRPPPGIAATTGNVASRLTQPRRGSTKKERRRGAGPRVVVCPQTLKPLVEGRRQLTPVTHRLATSAAMIDEALTGDAVVKA